jgi:hypothetical protein
MSHWSSGLPICFLSQGTQAQIPRGVLMWNRDSPVSVVSLHWWPRRDSNHWLCRPSLGASLGSLPTMCKPGTTWSQSSSVLVLLPASQPTESASGGEPCEEPAVSLHSHHVSLVQVDYPFPSCHKGPEFKSPGGYYCETRILLLALSCYKSLNFANNHLYISIYSCQLFLIVYFSSVG